MSTWRVVKLSGDTVEYRDATVEVVAGGALSIRHREVQRDGEPRAVETIFAPGQWLRAKETL